MDWEVHTFFFFTAALHCSVEKQTITWDLRQTKKSDEQLKKLHIPQPIIVTMKFLVQAGRETYLFTTKSCLAWGLTGKQYLKSNAYFWNSPLSLTSTFGQRFVLWGKLHHSGSVNKGSNFRLQPNNASKIFTTIKNKFTWRIFFRRFMFKILPWQQALWFFPLRIPNKDLI